MRYSNSLIIIFIIILTNVSCKNSRNENNVAAHTGLNDYAKYFSIKDSSDVINFQIIDAWSSTEEQYNDYSLDIKSAPLKRVVCMSTSHIAYMTALGLEDKIVGVSGIKYVSSKKVLKMVKEGKIADIGYEGSLNYEVLLKLKPDVVFTYGIIGENNLYINKIKELGLNVIALGDYLENHPLGKLEYLKLFGCMFNCNKKADSLYTAIKARYISIKESASKTSFKPKVLLNAPWNDAWYIPGKENYMSVLIADAGGETILSKPGKNKSETFSLEQVYKESANAEYWLNPNNYASIDELKNSNPLFKNIKPLKSGKVYNNIKRDTPQGGSDFWETGVIEPDVILNDLINILHPELGSTRQPVYYIHLK